MLQHLSCRCVSVDLVVTAVLVVLAWTQLLCLCELSVVVIAVLPQTRVIVAVFVWTQVLSFLFYCGLRCYHCCVCVDSGCCCCIHEDSGVIAVLVWTQVLSLLR